MVFALLVFPKVLLLDIIHTSDMHVVYIYNTFQISLKLTYDQTRLNRFARGEAPRRGGEANNRARS